MKLIISGTRTAIISPLDLWDHITQALQERAEEHIDEIIHGASGNVDKAAERLASIMQIPQKRFQAKWTEFGKSAGPMRNRAMAEYLQPGDACLIVWNGTSPGTKSMKEEAEKRGLEVFQFEAVLPTRPTKTALTSRQCASREHMQCPGGCGPMVSDRCRCKCHKGRAELL